MTRQQSPSKASRRTVLRCGLIASSSILASTGASTSALAADGSSASTESPESDQQSTVRATMASSQWRPGGTFELEAVDVPWGPNREGERGESEPTHETEAGPDDPTPRAHVIRYDFSSSYRAMLFTGDDPSIRRGGRYRLDPAGARATSRPRRLEVDVVALE